MIPLWSIRDLKRKSRIIKDKIIFSFGGLGKKSPRLHYNNLNLLTV